MRGTANPTGASTSGGSSSPRGSRTPKPTTKMPPNVLAKARHLAAHNALKTTGFRAAAKAAGYNTAQINAARQKFLTSAKAGRPATGAISKQVGKAFATKLVKKYKAMP